MNLENEILLFVLFCVLLEYDFIPRIFFCGLRCKYQGYGEAKKDNRIISRVGASRRCPPASHRADKTALPLSLDSPSDDDGDAFARRSSSRDSLGLCFSLVPFPSSPLQKPFGMPLSAISFSEFEPHSR